MSWNVQLELDPLLVERVRRFASGRSWTMERALGQLVERGLLAFESEALPRFDNEDAVALQAAIEAMERIEDDPGFSLIGRVGDEPPEPMRQAAG